MKKVILPLLFMLVTAVFLFGGNSAYAEQTAYSYYPYKFEVSSYDVVYDIAENCSIKVTEDLTISYQGERSTGFIRDIPVNNGAQVRNVEVNKVVNGTLTDVWYDVYIEDNDFISVDIGDSSNKYGKSESYRITYDYNITNSVVNENILSVNPIGQGWECKIYEATVKLILPDGFTDATCYKGVAGSTNVFNDFAVSTENGRQVINASFSDLPAYNGVTFDLNFKQGSIKNYTDAVPFLFAISAVAVLLLLIILKLFVFNKNQLTPVVNYEAPDKMDPLIMGKLIDNKVNSEDVTALIFYWADKNYIKINMDDKNDPLLIRVVQSLPKSSPYYEQILYSSLFRGGDLVRPSQLKYSYYRVIEQATASVNKQTRGLYDSKSIGISVLFAVLGGLLLGLIPTLVAYTQISSKMLLLAPFLFLIPALIVYALAEALMYYRLKFKKGTFIAMCVLLATGCLLFGVMYVFLIPQSVMGYGQKIFVYILCALIFSFSVILIMRTKNYTEKLNDIIGFKNFITLAEKNQLEMMLEDDPQFYYHILPYAQVLGVTDIWENKFEELTVPPPRWLTGDLVTTYVGFRMMNSVMRSSMGKISSGMVSRPSSSGSNGGGFGGRGGGGFSGGGFGGGGGRGR